MPPSSETPRDARPGGPSSENPTPPILALGVTWDEMWSLLVRLYSELNVVRGRLGMQSLAPPTIRPDKANREATIRLNRVVRLVPPPDEEWPGATFLAASREFLASLRPPEEPRTTQCETPRDIPGKHRQQVAGPWAEGHLVFLWAYQSRLYRCRLALPGQLAAGAVVVVGAGRFAASAPLVRVADQAAICRLTPLDPVSHEPDPATLPDEWELWAGRCDAVRHLFGDRFPEPPIPGRK